MNGIQFDKHDEVCKLFENSLEKADFVTSQKTCLKKSFCEQNQWLIKKPSKKSKSESDVSESNIQAQYKIVKKKFENIHFEKLMILGQFLQVTIAKLKVVNPRKLNFKLMFHFT